MMGTKNDRDMTGVLYGGVWENLSWKEHLYNYYHRITGLTNPPNADDEATNKKYVDDNITKSHIKPT